MGKFMSDAILVLYAAVLVVNGCFLLGKVEAKSVWPVNVIVGVIAIICSIYMGLTGSAFVATLLLLFAVVFVIMGINLASGLEGKSMGYYCLFGVPVCLIWAYTFYISLGAVTFGVFSVLWAVLFGLFSGILAFGKEKWAGPTGYYCFAIAFFTLLIPASLSFNGIPLP
ncbi:MAG: hypothetical protein COB23_02445 [Methylophaga sp.]|nr:MAG: hypothetical protein COB23_02445 [Methylophaga sp.]